MGGFGSGCGSGLGSGSGCGGGGGWRGWLLRRMGWRQGCCEAESGEAESGECVRLGLRLTTENEEDGVVETNVPSWWARPPSRLAAITTFHLSNTP